MKTGLPWLPTISPTLVIGLTAFSVLSLVIVGGIVARMVKHLPSDYFLDNYVPPERHVAMLVLRNVVGGVLLIAGIAMLVLPGQGMLTMLAALLLMDFPGKTGVARWMMRRKRVRRVVERMRRRAGEEPFALEASTSD
jgi:hypothetical protein